MPNLDDGEYQKWCSGAYSGMRRQNYNAANITPEEMAVALWEMIVENRPELAQELQRKREEIKSMHPKP